MTDPGVARETFDAIGITTALLRRMREATKWVAVSATVFYGEDEEEATLTVREGCYPTLHVPAVGEDRVDLRWLGSD